MPLYEFQPSFTVDQTDLTLTSTGSGVHFNKAVTVDLGILDRISGTVSSNAELLANNYVNSISVDILNINGSSEYTNFLTDYKSNIFTFTEYDNINVFGKYTKDFGLRFTLSESSETYTSEFYLYGNLPEFSGIQIQDSTGTTFHSSSESSKTAVNSTGQTGALTSVITFNNDIAYTAFNRVDVYSSSSSSEFASQINPNPVFSHNLTNEPTQSFDINEGSLPSNTPVYLHYVPYANLGSGAAWTVGPYTFEDNPTPTTAFLTIDQSGNFVQDIASVLAVGNSSEVLDFSSNKLVFNVYGSSEDVSRNSVNSFASVILLGTKNKIFGDYDAIVGGTTNVISGDATNPSDFNFIGAGSGNDITGSDYSSTIGGYNNDIFSSNYSVLGGGRNNLIQDDGASFIGGGSNNKIQDGSASFIGGGGSNKIYTEVSVIAGGNGNTITGDGYSFIGGGEGNYIYTQFGTILGGENNVVSGVYSTVSAGENNHIYGKYSFIAGGLSSRVSGDYASAIGRRIKIQDSHSGALVLADGQNRDHNSTIAHSATLDFANGVYINTGDLRISAGDVSISGSLNATGDITMGGNVVLTGIASGDITGALGYTPVDVSDTGSFLTAHPSISAAASSDNSGRTYIQDVLLDSFGHVTGLNTSSEDADTIYTLSSFGVTATSVELNQLDGVTLGSLASLSSVNAATITDNSVGAAELNVVGNGTATQFLRSDADGSFTWAVPTDTNTTYSVGSGISLSGTTFSVAAGGGLTQTATGLSHTDTSSQASVDNSNGTVIQDVFLDTYGHITGIGSTNLDSRYNNYSLPSGTSSVRGGFKIGYSENGKNYPVEVLSEQMFVNVPWTDANTTYSAGSGISLSSTTFSVAAGGGLTQTATGLSHTDTSSQASVNNSNGTVIQDVFLDTYGHITGIGSTNLDSRYNNYSLPSGTSSVRGGFKIGYSENGKNYPVEVLSEQMFVNVPWTDANTTYSAGSGISLSSTTFSVAAGGGLTQTATGLSHTDTSSQASVNNSNGTVIQDVFLDTYGHITGIGSTNLDSRYNNYSLPSGTSSERGGFKIGYSVDGQNYPVEVSSEQMFVTVPWVDTIYTLSSFGVTATSSELNQLDGVTLGPLASLSSVNAATITDNSVGAAELNVVGNGTATQFLRSDADGSFTWAVPTDTNTTYSVGSGISLSGTTFSVAAGGGLTQTATGLSHTDTSSQASVDNSNGTVIQDVFLDTYGHITGIGSTNLDSRYNNYSLPSGTSSVRGGFKIGYSENGKNYPVEVLSEQMFVNVPWTDANTTYSAGSGISLSSTTFSVAAGGGLTQTATGLSHTDTSSQASVDNSNGTVIQDVFLDTYGHITGIGSTNLDSRYNNYSLPSGTSSVRGGFKIGYSENGKNYPVEVLSEQMFVNVPWVDTNTTYTLSSFGVTATSVELNQLDGVTLGSLASLSSVNAATITDNSVGAAELNVVGNGTATQFLRSDADGSFTWAVPTDTNTTYSVGSGISLSGTTFSVAAGGGLTQTATGLSHTDTSSQASVDNSNGTVIQDVFLDTYGHITGIGSTNLDSRYNNYSLPSGTSSVRGGFKIGYSENGKNYPVEVLSEQMFVTVPWVDTIYTLTSGDITGALGFSPISTETDDQTLDEVLAQGNSSELGIDVGAITGSALTIDTNTLFVDSTNNRVGIGTTNPSAKLEVAISENVNSYSDGAIQVVSSSPIAFVAPSNLNPSLNRWGFTLREGGEGHFGIRDYRHANTRVTIDDNGNVGIGTTTPCAKLEVNGHFAATTKSFIIPNPKKGGRLQYGVVETDEHSVYIRGKSNQNLVELPEEWEWLVDEDSVTVQLTSIGQIQQLFVTAQNNKYIKVCGLANNGEYNYVVYGTRKDVDPLQKNLK
jgi:hypothetical protein